MYTETADCLLIGNSLLTGHFCNSLVDVADLSLDVLRDLEEAGGVKLVHARTRWGLHAMHFAAGNFTHGCQVLTRLLEYCNLPAYQATLHDCAFMPSQLPMSNECHLDMQQQPCVMPCLAP